MSGRLVHPDAMVHPSARLGVGCFIGRGVVIEEDVTIGNYTCIGGLPEHREFFYDYGAVKNKGVLVLKGARIFEFVTIHGGTKYPTVIGKGAAVFNHSHVAHDCFVGDEAVIGGQVSLAGHTMVMEKAQIAGKSCTHQFSIVGAYGFLSAMSYLKGDIPNGEKWIGNPARHAGLNDVGLERAQMTHAQCLEKFEEEFARLVKIRGTR